MRKAEAHRRLGDVVSAIDANTKAVALQPDDDGALRQLCQLMLTAGQRDQARPYRARLLAIETKHLPPRLTDGLTTLWQRARDQPLESEELDWAWELADKAVWDKAEWQVAATWGHAANVLVRQWWDGRPQEASQIDELLAEVDLRDVFAVTAGGRACLLVGAHVGQPTAVINTLRARLPFRNFGSADRDQLDSPSLIPATSNHVAVVRALVREVKRGTVIGVMADTPWARTSHLVEFLGRKVHLPAIVPKLIHAYDLPSFWSCQLWRHGRVVHTLERLPDPLPDEPPAAWTQRWFSAYLGRLERVMRGAPENLGLESGIWANANRTVALELRRRNAARGERNT
jgi:hypothetical protein